MRGFMKYACVLALPLLVAAGAAQAQTWPDGGNPSEGATLYDSCVPCHTLNGNGLVGIRSDGQDEGVPERHLHRRQIAWYAAGIEAAVRQAASGSCGLYQQDVIPRKKGFTSPCS